MALYSVRRSPWSYSGQLAVAVAVVLGLFCAGTIFGEQAPEGKVPTESTEKPVDARTKLVVDSGLDLIKANCLECHSSRLILQNRGNRDHWRGMLKWMEETQGLEPLGKAEDAVLDYLVRNYGVEERRRRRSPIPEELMPPAGSGIAHQP